jgi:5-methylcytosine-specific restriction endonuclease McrA
MSPAPSDPAPCLVSHGKSGARRARQFGVPVIDLTNEEWQLILVAFEYHCAYCGIQPAQLTQDHIVPLSKGGSHTKSNILPACNACNQRKGNKFLAEFLFPEGKKRRRSR